MITREAVLVRDEIRRVGFRFDPAVIRVTVPSGTIGMYCLLREAMPIYIGRSDHCVLTRLASRPLVDVATHFLWQPSQAPWGAFCLEAYWWHRLIDTPTLRNAIHPARPADEMRDCPFCDSRDREGLKRLLPWAGTAHTTLQLDNLKST
jgi:hypothetical protein